MTTPEPFTALGVDGIRIAADRLGDPDAASVVFLHGGGQTRRSWGRAAVAVAARGWQAITVDLRGHGESDWSDDGDYRVVSFAADVLELMRELPPRPVLVGASLGGFTGMLLAGELEPTALRALVLVDIVPDMNPAGASRIHQFMYDRMESGFASLDEVADMIQEYNPNRNRPTDLNRNQGLLSLGHVHLPIGIHCTFCMFPLAGCHLSTRNQSNSHYSEGGTCCSIPIATAAIEFASYTSNSTYARPLCPSKPDQQCSVPQY